ncbi:cysteine desulfurase family protein [Geothrix sp. 21YS21S-2]|uniref:cysteine desulfurase family protein n=1 Tax=Geothrix sp. 21YS21S-2 TaxID=3068893 RepID=UPI0027BAA633|nr:aminotransferase class V-fold PLP-dependent enzyme [Geothrix sp. 21YS21S-2]
MPEAPVYLDNNATTRLAPEALEAMLPFLGDQFGNAGSAHGLGRLSEGAVVVARERVAALLGCAPAELVFNSGGTEGINHAFRGVFEALPARRHFITTAVEHSAVLACADWLRKQGAEVTVLGVDAQGRLDLAELEAALTPATALVSVMAANNETGVLFPLEDIARIVKARGVLLHVDGTQALGKVPVDLARIPVDLFNFSGHKFHGPKGAGGLFLRRGLRLRPFMIGGGQERGRRGGTENVPGIVGLGVAADLARTHLAGDSRVRTLRDRLEAFILDRIPGSAVNGAQAPRVPNTSMISFGEVEGEAVLLRLDEAGVCVSTGSACTTGQKEPSHVLRAMGAPDAMGAVRFSLSRYTTEDEVARVEAVLPGILSELRSQGPLGRR